MYQNYPPRCPTGIDSEQITQNPWCLSLPSWHQNSIGSPLSSLPVIMLVLKSCKWRSDILKSEIGSITNNQGQVCTLYIKTEY